MVDPEMALGILAALSLVWMSALSSLLMDLELIGSISAVPANFAHHTSVITMIATSEVASIFWLADSAANCCWMRANCCRSKSMAPSIYPRGLPRIAAPRKLGG